MVEEEFYTEEIAPARITTESAFDTAIAHYSTDVIEATGSPANVATTNAASRESQNSIASATEEAAALAAARTVAEAVPSATIGNADSKSASDTHTVPETVALRPAEASGSNSLLAGSAALEPAQAATPLESVQGATESLLPAPAEKSVLSSLATNRVEADAQGSEGSIADDTARQEQGIGPLAGSEDGPSVAKQPKLARELRQSDRGVQPGGAIHAERDADHLDPADLDLLAENLPKRYSTHGIPTEQDLAIRVALGMEPERTNTSIAEKTGASKTAVRLRRKAMEQSGDIPAGYTGRSRNTAADDQVEMMAMRLSGLTPDQISAATGWSKRVVINITGTRYRTSDPARGESKALALDLLRTGKYTQREIGEKTGLTQQAVSDIKMKLNLSNRGGDTIEQENLGVEQQTGHGSGIPQQDEISRQIATISGRSYGETSDGFNEPAGNRGSSLGSTLETIHPADPTNDSGAENWARTTSHQQDLTVDARRTPGVPPNRGGDADPGAAANLSRNGRGTQVEDASGSGGSGQVASKKNAGRLSIAKLLGGVEKTSASTSTKTKTIAELLPGSVSDRVIMPPRAPRMAVDPGPDTGINLTVDRTPYANRIIQMMESRFNGGEGRTAYETQQQLKLETGKELSLGTIRRIGDRRYRK
ncbi:hypothetical protein [Paraburkholderia heleia]|uniref:hypothetical protein n=1 Tax=Paraburkholderia heleia TaxID=634127 RepID=UPI002AB7B416|nr:hypothetical protein [Paraburkholderia heleia]